MGCLCLFVSLLIFGSETFSLSQVVSAIFSGRVSANESALIINELRLPMATAALLTGVSLGVTGLLLQTIFNNPLAGPSILGVSNGASLGVAIVMLVMGGGACMGLTHYAGVLAGAVAGAAVMLVILLIFTTLVRGSVMLLIVGILLSYLASSAISILNFYATSEGVHSYVIWGLGSFAGVNRADLNVFLPVAVIALAATFLLVKPLNAMLLGREYATSMGVNVLAVRAVSLMIAGVLTAVVTAFCGPIGFLGIVIPHVARMSTGCVNHLRLLPATMLWGAFGGLLCALISVVASRGSLLPVNAITPVLAIPIILYVIVNRHKLNYFK